MQETNIKYPQLFYEPKTTVANNALAKWRVDEYSINNRIKINSSYRLDITLLNSINHNEHLYIYQAFVVG